MVNVTPNDSDANSRTRYVILRATNDVEDNCTLMVIIQINTNISKKVFQLQIWIQADTH